jgi:hypothetical protein
LDRLKLGFKAHPTTCFRPFGIDISGIEQFLAPTFGIASGHHQGLFQYDVCGRGGREILGGSFGSIPILVLVALVVLVVLVVVVVAGGGSGGGGRRRRCRCRRCSPGK